MSSVMQSAGAISVMSSSRTRRSMLVVAIVLLTAWCAIYHETLWAMVLTWSHSQTFMHCFLIAPLAGYLVYSRRSTLRGVVIQPFLPGLIAIGLASVLWLAGWAAAADVVQEFAVVIMIPALVLTVFGLDLVRRTAGPLAFLLFAVPFGEILIPPLREFTADSVVVGLHFSGIGVVRSGFYLSTAAGDFEVERACSGVRYLIASFALGTLFALLYLHSWRRRAIFLALSLIVPIIANGERAYLIVALAHISDMKIAAGVDHLIYGWIFFGLVMFMLFAVGARMADEPSETSNGTTSSSSRINLLAAALAVCAMLLGPVAAYAMEAREAAVLPATPKIAHLGGLWIDEPLRDTSWIPAFPGQIGVFARSYRKLSDPSIDVAIAWYDNGGKLISEDNRAFDKQLWREQVRRRRTVVVDGKEVQFLTVNIDSVRERRRRSVWLIYVIGDRVIASDYVGKMTEAWTRVSSPGRPLWSVALSVASDDAHDVDGDAVVADFVREHLGALLAREEGARP